MKRDASIDSAAGIMIIYMVFTHVCIRCHLQQSMIYDIGQHLLFFFMPWFFFKAGMFFKAGNNKEVFMKSAKRLIKPFIIYSLIGHVCFCVLNIVKGNISLGVFFPIKELLLVGSISGNLPLWFLLSLFGCRLIFNYALNKNVPVPLVAIVSLAFASLLHFTGYEYPLYVANISTGLFFMSLGYLITMRLTITPPLLAICLILWILAQLFPSFVSMRNNELTCGYYLLWMVYSLAAIISINAICQKFRRIFSCFEIVGRYSMEIYCIHWIPLMFL